MVPYILLSLLLLTAVLFAQQAARLAELVIYADLPASILGGIGAALLPGVLIFSIPLATLAGIIVGFSRMGSDSEIVAMRAAGVGTWTMIWPALTNWLSCLPESRPTCTLKKHPKQREISSASLSRELWQS